MEALARFHQDVTWTGFIAEGGMGPGTPPMTATGRGTHEEIQDGRWIVGSYEQDQFLPDGTFVLKWQLHWVAGWDPVEKEYRATLADSYGHATVMRGHIDGDRLIYESVEDASPRIRLVWDRSDPKRMTCVTRSIARSLWSLVEQYDCRPITTGGLS